MLRRNYLLKNLEMAHIYEAYVSFFPILKQNVCMPAKSSALNANLR